MIQSVPGMRNKEALAYLYINLHNELNNLVDQENFDLLLYIYILKKEGMQK